MKLDMQVRLETMEILSNGALPITHVAQKATDGAGSRSILDGANVKF